MLHSSFSTQPTFIEILKEYRKLDDTIVMRLNRANARMRDRNRHQTPKETQTLQDQACANVWRELVGKKYFMDMNLKLDDMLL